MIVLDEVSKSYDGGRSYAVEGLSLEVQEGETLVLLGSSGSGKTTALKMINRIIQPTSGTISVDGEDVSRRDPVTVRRSIGYVFQGIGLFPHLTIGENVEIVPRLAGWPASRRRARTGELLDLVGLPPEEYAERFPDELSGGQAQRVGVARALAADSDYLLMDEPFGALDALTRDTLEQEVLELTRRLGKTVIFVTHDIFEALTMADRIAVLHSGRLEQVGTKDEVLGRPASEFVRQLFQQPAKKAAELRAYFEET